MFGEAPEVARLLTATLVAAFGALTFELCRRTIKGWPGYVGGAACVLALLLISEIFRYGCAAMTSLPAILCIGLGWALMTISCSPMAACLTGMFLAFGLAIKPLGAPAIPAVLGGILLAGWTREGGRKRAVQLLLITLGSFTFSLVAFFWPVFGREGGDAVYRTHEVSGQWSSLNQVGRFLSEDGWLFLSALFGLGALVGRRRAELSSLSLWIVLGAVALARHSPVWQHHRYLLLIPAVPLFGLGVGETLALASRKGSSIVHRVLATGSTVLMLATAVLLFPLPRFDEIKRAFQTKPKGEDPFVRIIAGGVPDARRMVTSRQMSAYRLGLEIPPSQAVTSRKRFARGTPSLEDLVETSIEFDPDVVALDDRWPRSVATRIRRELRDTHLLAYEKGEALLLVRRTMISPTLQMDVKRRPPRRTE